MGRNPDEDPPLSGLGIISALLEEAGQNKQLLLRMQTDANRETQEIYETIREPTMEYLRCLGRNYSSLITIERELGSTFANQYHVRDSLQGKSRGLFFFPQIQGEVEGMLGSVVESYIAGVSLEPILKQECEKDAENFVAKRTVEVARSALGTYAASKLALPELMEEITKRHRLYLEHLEKRFVKSEERDEQKGREMSMRRMQRREDEDSIITTPYTKCPLYEGNIVLTDVLLDLEEQIPRYNVVSSGRTGKTRKSISTHELYTCAETLSALADPLMFTYLQNPQRFFEQIEGILSGVLDISFKVEWSQAELADTSYLRQEIPHEARRKIASMQNGRAKRMASKIGKMDLEGVVQNGDEILPDTQREKQLMEFRERLFDSLYEGLETLSKIQDLDDRLDQAKTIARKVVDAKDKIVDLQTSTQKRKLRRDKAFDNEFYTGASRHPGQFYFKRSPAPEVAMEDVIGASFNKAKRNLKDVIETCETSRLLRMTAPSRRIKSNVCLIGPPGCGKTELAKAACADKRTIGGFVSMADVLTAWNHESVGNIKRVYDGAKEIMEESVGTKPFILAFDEYDGWFKNSGRGGSTDTDMTQIEDVMLEVLEGIVDYSGIVTVAMTNKPENIPPRILRRFRHVDIVGQLTQDERAEILSMYLEKTLPLSDGIQEHYLGWAKELEDAPGDVVRKVVDELHFEIVPEFIRKDRKEARRLEGVLARRERNNGTLSEKDSLWIRESLAKKDIRITPDQVGDALKRLKGEPHIARQIKDARTAYREAEELMANLAGGSDVDDAKSDFGFRPRN